MLFCRFHSDKTARESFINVNKKEIAWLIKVADLADPERCLKRLARSVKRSARFHSNPEKAARFIVKSAFPSAKMQVVR